MAAWIRTSLGFAVLVGGLASAAAQNARTPKFGDVSIRTAVMGARGGTRGCDESLRMTSAVMIFTCAPLEDILATAYRIPDIPFPPDRIIGPDWLKNRDHTRFDIRATLPRGTAEDELPDMFQAELVSKFKLTVHRVAAEHAVYGLVVAPGGLQLRPATEPQPPPAPPPSPVAQPIALLNLGGIITVVEGADGGSIYRNPRVGEVRASTVSATLRREASNISLAGLADLLNRIAPLTLPVVDLTGQPGRFQVALNVDTNRAPSPGDTAVLDAINRGLEPLGLRLEQRRTTLENLVIDHLDKAPPSP